MKKIFVSTFVIVAFVIYSVFHGKTGTAATKVASTAGGGNSATTNSTTYKDGTYTGSIADAFYGNIQVQTTISNGKITDVKFLQHPSDQARSIMINLYADPILTQEAVQAQNAQVDTVSGATDSSQAFIQSLQSALDQAKA